jgi:bacillithiol biosynthesis cysteine-adding enzyme BshC
MVWKALREYEAVSAEPISTAAAGTSARLAVDVREFGWIRPLAGEYAYNFPAIAPLYAGDPASPDAWRDAIARTQRHQRRRAEIAAILTAQQTRRGAPPAARDAAATLADTNTVAVITGQQAGAFGGPLFTLLKAITAIQLARATSDQYGVPCVALFWVDAEDHDWEEVRGCTVLDAQFHPQTITLAPPRSAGEIPVASLRLDDRIEQSLAELEATLPPTEFTASAMRQLRDAYRPGVGVADAFARWLEAVLGPYGLAVFESADAAAKPLVGEVFGRELQDPGRTAALAAQAGEALAARGHQPQVVPQPDSLSLFHLDGVRQPIRRQGNQFLIGETAYTLTALTEEARARPDRFSPNVLLRPIVQDTLFPTICYVAGPSELAYLGQLRGIYERFGVPMPLMYPRATATIIDSATARFLSKHPLPLTELQRQDESALNRLLESLLPASIEHAFTEAEDAVQRAMQRVIEVIPELDPTLAGAARTTLGKMEHDLRGLHAKGIQAAKRRDETLRRQFTRAQAQIFPLGQPQERTLGVVYFLNRYGPAVVDRLLDDLPLELGRHWVMTI